MKKSTPAKLLQRSLSIALVSRSNKAGGGASRIAEELSEWLLTKGYNVVHYCGFPIGPLKSFQLPLYANDAKGKLARGVHRITRRLGLNELLPIEYFTTIRRSLSTFDVVHFHDLNRAVSPLTMALCARKRAVFFTAHDCSCFTGGCIYPLRCERHTKSCGKCPQLTAMEATADFTSLNLAINRRLAMNSGVQYVFPSLWLQKTASRSLQFSRKAMVIPNGFSSGGYAFCSKSSARRTLGIRDAQHVVIVAAHFLADPRKGVRYALTAIRSVSDLKPLIMFVGLPPNDLEAALPTVNFWLAGYVHEQGRLGLLFSAADVFLFTSLEDNLPITVQEALASGTPVVGFSAGGVPEMVDHGRTGWLCTPGDQGALNQNLRGALTCQSLSNFCDAARSTVQERFSMDTFGQRHLSLYEESLP